MNNLPIQTYESVVQQRDALEKKLLAYEQAAKNPIGYTDDEELRDLSKMGTAYIVNGEDVNIDVNDGRWFPVYRAPVLPKQPVIPDEITSASAPEVFEIAAEAERLGIRGTYSSYAVGWNACRAEMLKAQQNEPQNIPKSIPAPLDAQDLELYVGMLENSDSDDEDGELNNTQLIVWLKELQRRRALSAQPVSEPYKSAANDIIAERQRQISAEGWTPEHDDVHTDFQLALAAACYAQNVADYAAEYYQPHSSIDWTDAPEPEAWPWCLDWWKPTNPRRDLVKAGALILAEIERLDRASTAQESE